MSNGNIYFTPPEYYGLVGLGNAVRDVGQSLEERGLRKEEQERYKTDQERKDRQEQIEQFKLGIDVGKAGNAPNEWIAEQYAKFFEEPGFVPKWDAEAYRLGKIEEFSKLTPEQRELPEYQESADLYYKEFYDDTLDPKIRRRIADIELETAELGLESTQREGIRERAFMAGFEGRNLTANEILAGMPGVPEHLKNGGQFALDYWMTTEEGRLGLSQMDAQTQLTVANTRLANRRHDALGIEMEKLAAEVGWTGIEGELKTIQAKLLFGPLVYELGERAAPAIIAYLDGNINELSPDERGYIRAAEGQQQELLDAQFAGAFTEALANGDQEAELLELLLRLGKDNPGLRDTFLGPIKALTANLLNKYRPESAEFVDKLERSWRRDREDVLTIDPNTMVTTAPISIDRSLDAWLERNPKPGEEPGTPSSSADTFLDAAKDEGKGIDRAIELIEYNYNHYTTGAGKGTAPAEDIADIKEGWDALIQLRDSTQTTDDEIGADKAAMALDTELNTMTVEELNTLYETVMELRREAKDNMVASGSTGRGVGSTTAYDELTRRAVKIRAEIYNRR